MVIPTLADVDGDCSLTVSVKSGPQRQVEGGEIG